eukprot:gnl/Hemi2/15365_TR5170_c0_g1_i1.p1 gnl/Hemi2/15365_TR5170_c0_g1~~gnl/Hemi2/15365_TR5170_c0_g1_i1.p1  ORF type:complete len:112 (+),score=20.39 gnl/Hemi2/15365_TR5170_c0_g1_i1:196-531(+)
MVRTDAPTWYKLAAEHHLQSNSHFEGENLERSVGGPVQEPALEPRGLLDVLQDVADGDLGHAEAGAELGGAAAAKRLIQSHHQVKMLAITSIILSHLDAVNDKTGCPCTLR